MPEDAGSGEGRGKSPAEPLFFSTRLTPIPMADVIPQLQEDQSRPHHRVRVKQGVLSGLEGTLIEQLDGDRILIAYGADADAANSRARGAYIAIGAAAVELLSG